MGAEDDGAITLRAAGDTDVGKRRTHNEDSLSVREDLGLFVVADGAGGHNAGEVAARLACVSICNYIGATVRAFWEKPEFDRFGLPNGARRLVAAVKKANADVVEISRSSNRYRGMGTTVVAALFSPRSTLLHVAHVGDSRCYRLRRGHLELLTQDHSLLQEVLETQPDLDDNVIARFPRSVVTRALGMDKQLRVSVNSHSVLPGDRYLLCSDGLSSYVEPVEIEAVVRREMPPETIVAELIGLANAMGGRDNIGVLVIDVEVDDGITTEYPSQHPTIPDLDDDSPELMILGMESIDEMGTDPQMHVVTSDDVDSKLLVELGNVLRRGRE